MNYIEKFLESYIEDNTYNYAVMISGDWGTGKTFFIKNYINNHKNNKNFIYVPLYGIKKLDEISKYIYAEILSKNTFYDKTVGKLKGKKISVLANIGGRIAMDLCKNKWIDINDIKNIYKTLVNLDKYIIIFDDIERSSIDINDILGYINNLVEHSKIKAIIVANEPKITDKSYKEIKEKLVANTIIYEPNIELVFKTLISELKEDETLKDSLIKNIDIFTKKSNKNIRTYQFFLSKYRKAYKKLSEMYNGTIEDDLLVKVIDEMYTSSICYKNGQEDSPRNLHFISNYVYFDNWDKNEVKNITDLYIEKRKREKYQNKLNKLSCWSTLEDEEIRCLLDEIKYEVKNNVYTAEDFVKIVRLVLILKETGFKENYIEDIINEMKKKDYNSQDLKYSIYLNDGDFSNNQEKNKKMSLEFKKIINEIAKNFDLNLNTDDIEIVTKILKKDNWIDELQVWLRNDYSRNKEIFILCDIYDLRNKIEALNNKDMHKLRNIFFELKFFKKDKKFLEDLKQETNNLIIKEKKIVKKEVLLWFYNDIERIIANLK
ncbi:P-loop NTPase fold protein [Clostridium perfringens]|uniref:P-loop NTPase fold protein n=1 Tax=Clostridium perfringens TaxID=1502 RepID=UPI00189920C0|nr:P-loop NTPase fold protein [Clostridium perfringens]HAT4093248.1 hypothetical protein [Clostridium perfringens]